MGLAPVARGSFEPGVRGESHQGPEGLPTGHARAMRVRETFMDRLGREDNPVGVSERVAMQISGHKTRPILERYNIVFKADSKGATNKHSHLLAD